MFLLGLETILLNSFSLGITLAVCLCNFSSHSLRSCVRLCSHMDALPGCIAEIDEEMQIGLRAAFEVLELNPKDRISVQECFSKVVNSLNRHEELLCSFKLNAHTNCASRTCLLCTLESDFMWKSALIASIPLTATAEQIRAVFTLVKARPYLAELL